MKPALAFRQPKVPSNWQALPNGELIKSTIDQALSPWLPKFFGYHLLKIGGLSASIDCSDCAIKHQVVIDSAENSPSVIADIDDLPLLEHSVDVSILAHALEFSVDPHHVLREASRVLIPNGYMVITGFNPLSLAGVNKFIPYRRNELPWSEQFFTPMRVKDWLQLMGFEVLEDFRTLHSTLVSEINPDHKVRHLWQKFADNYLSAFGSVYVIIAKKRVHPLTPIKPKWKVRPSFQPVKVHGMNSSKTKHSR